MRVRPRSQAGHPQPRTLRQRIVLALAVVLPLLSGACAVQKPYHFTPRSVTKISYDPNRCKELPDGRYKCQDVVLTVASIQPASIK